MWFQGWFGVDWSMSCWAHDLSWKIGTVLQKVKSDFELLLDVWAVAAVAGKWWQRSLIRANAVAMYLAVATVGWAIFIPKWIDRKISDLM
jgi:hypothetical protein